MNDLIKSSSVPRKLEMNAQDQIMIENRLKRKQVLDGFKILRTIITNEFKENDK
ncbi:MAG: hypothetical protein ACQEXX_01460 [Bacillota bacterium]